MNMRISSTLLLLRFMNSLSSVLFSLFNSAVSFPILDSYSSGFFNWLLLSSSVILTFSFSDSVFGKYIAVFLFQVICNFTCNIPSIVSSLYYLSAMLFPIKLCCSNSFFIGSILYLYLSVNCMNMFSPSVEATSCTGFVVKNSSFISFIHLLPVTSSLVTLPVLGSGLNISFFIKIFFYFLIFRVLIYYIYKVLSVNIIII